MNAADKPPLIITGNDSKKQGPPNSKGIKMNAADKTTLKSPEMILKMIPKKFRIKFGFHSEGPSVLEGRRSLPPTLPYFCSNKSKTFSLTNLFSFC